MGKPHACWVGAQSAETPWLCFVDADVRASPMLLTTLLAAAEGERLDMLSLAPFQLLGSFWERVIVPAGLMLVACALDLRRSGDPAGDIAVNGQVMLVRSSAYFEVGGHAAVRREVCEDKGLAERVRASGRRYRFFDGAQLAQTRMYSDLASLWSGFAKNAIDIIGNARDTLAVAAAGFLVAWAALLIPAVAAIALSTVPTTVHLAGFALSLLGSLIVLAVHVATARHFRIPLVYGVLFPVAYSAVAALALHSVAVRRAGRVTWKGRVYDIPSAAAPRSR
jgi:chlorobactene glucosyltransferase